MQREINSKIAKQHNEINKIKKEIKEIDILIFKEANNYQNINKKDRNAVNQMLIYKNQPSNEFLKFLKQVEKNIYLKQEEEILIFLISPIIILSISFIFIPAISFIFTISISFTISIFIIFSFSIPIFIFFLISFFFL